MLKRLSYIILFLFLLSCSDWLDVNDNPNEPSQVAIDQVLPAGTSSLAFYYGGRFQVLGALWAQHWTQSPGASQYSGLDDYDINSATFDNVFQGMYAGCLADLEYVRQHANTTTQQDYYIIATVVQSFAWMLLADLYDYIPFTNALRGAEGIAVSSFDSGSLVYDSLVVRLKDAIDMFDYFIDNKESPEENDLIFASDMEQWIAFANSLLLKIYLRQVNVRPEIAENGIRELYDQEAEFLSSDAAMTAFSNSTGNRSPLYQSEIISLGNNPNLILSNTLASYFIEHADFDRLDALFNTPQAGGDHKALVQGDYNPSGESASINSTSYSKPVLSASMPVFLMTSTESKLLQAEAIIRFNLKPYADARVLYKEAVAEAYQRLGLEGYETAFIEGSGDYVFPAEGNNLDTYLETIITQKWLALAGFQSIETFFEQNRTGIPAVSAVSGYSANYTPGEFTPSSNNVTSNRLPQRLIYPESEERTGSGIVPDIQPVWEPVWWAMN